jgi:hypothetical protein
MCCCGKPTRNDEPGYRWQPNDIPVMRGVSAPPAPSAGWEIIHDEPGRCSPTVGGKVYRVDHHSHHYRVFRDEFGSVRAFVRHGGGVVEIGNSYDLGKLSMVLALLADSDARFVALMAVEGLTEKAADKARDDERRRWQNAAAEKRIKTRKRRGRNLVDVWIEEQG